MANYLRVLFYDDAANFGGHEIMALQAIRFLVLQPKTEIGFVFFRGNNRLSQFAAEMSVQHTNFTALPQDYASQRRQVLRTLISYGPLRVLTKKIQEYSPDIMVVVQGGIAHCSLGLLAGKWSGVHTVSYIPMTHPESMFTASRWKAGLREMVNGLYYRLPDEFITISARMKMYLNDRGLRQKITVVSNGLDFTGYEVMSRHEARAKFGLSESDKVVVMSGRIEFWQKRHDLAVRALAKVIRKIDNLKLLVIGEGPDACKLKEIVHAAKLADIVVFAPWTNNMSAVYSAVDLLLLPSRYEGVPLVMLEAMYYRLPVIASNVDGMVDILPVEWLFQSGDADALAERIVTGLGRRDLVLLDYLKRKVLTEFSQETFTTAFFQTIVAAKANKVAV